MTLPSSTDLELNEGFDFLNEPFKDRAEEFRVADSTPCLLILRGS